MDQMKKAIRESYGEIARRARGHCECGCGPVTRVAPESVGYVKGQVGEVPRSASLGLGCGNPTAIAGLRPGEVVLDLGSGGGFDCFLAANAVGPKGRVIGVDMTPEMIEIARRNAERGGYSNVEFRLGEIESLPAADAEVDVVISNCVINLVPDKAKAFAEAFRALRPGGRLHVSDIVFAAEPPECLRDDVAAYVSCVAGALLQEEYLAAIAAAGFRDTRVETERDASELLEGCGCAPAPDGNGPCCCGASPELPVGLVKSITVSAGKAG
jgi:SAM-dependent methyltransferase